MRKSMKNRLFLVSGEQKTPRRSISTWMKSKNLPHKPSSTQIWLF